MAMNKLIKGGCNECDHPCIHKPVSVQKAVGFSRPLSSRISLHINESLPINDISTTTAIFIYM